jgi:hypothetical protein
MTATVVLHPAHSKPFADALAMAKTLHPEEPVFCFSPAELKSRARQFIDNFPGLVTYAVKCNPTEEVLVTLADAGITTWDVASVQEMAAVQKVQPKAKFNYHNPVKSRREISDAYNVYGCRRFAVDCREEVQKIIDVIGKDETVELSVRLVLPRERGTSAHDFFLHQVWRARTYLHRTAATGRRCRLSARAHFSSGLAEQGAAGLCAPYRGSGAHCPQCRHQGEEAQCGRRFSGQL